MTFAERVALVAFAAAGGVVAFLALALLCDLTPAPGFMTTTEGVNAPLCVAITLGAAACLFAGRGCRRG